MTSINLLIETRALCVSWNCYAVGKNTRKV